MTPRWAVGAETGPQAGSAALQQQQTGGGGGARRRRLTTGRLFVSPMPPLPLQCLQYKTDQQADLKKIEKLNRAFFALMATGAPPPPGARPLHCRHPTLCALQGVLVAA